ncbi:MAG: nucleotide exchange factor GrpE [Chloroflexi bacterium]|nr:nucleotide exchange factor GrpE [Chloroflexota bacterium]MYJ02513.1 nucleotide exchange factor GrpE [Chloroflexota bacterium]
MIADEQAVEQHDDVVETGLESEPASEPESEFDALRQESARNLAGWQRAQADYENLKRRSAQDVRDRVQQSQRGILLDLLDLADDFERAEREAPQAPGDDPDPDDPWRKGVELISQKLHALLLKQQVSRIETANHPFDPELHEAVGQLPGGHNEIVAVLRTGYTIGPTSNPRVLRATQVMVGDGSIESSEPQDLAEDLPTE